HLPLWELQKWGQRMGLENHHFISPIMKLSGGYRMRCKLIGLIGQEPNLLLLDEPTNYLDLESLLVLEEFLQTFRGAFLLISHDREFLRRTTDHTLEVESGEFTKYNGHIDDYFEQKSLIREQLEKQALSREAKRKAILQFAARFGAKATKARQVQSRLKQLNKMDSIDITPLAIGATIPISTPVRTGRHVLTTNNLSIGYEEKTLLSGVEFSLERSDHVGIVGLNGAGKTSLLKALAGILPPQKGEIKWGHGVSIGYYAQHVAEELDEGDSVYEALMRKAHPDIIPQQARDLAGALLFSGADIDKRIKVLSGGEKARVALGQILLKRSPLLLLDEPTNHLDFHTVEALTQALQSYEGALIVVSHDRSFIGRLAKKIIEIKDGQVLLYPGSYEEYVWSQQQKVRSLTPSHSNRNSKSNSSSSTSSDTLKSTPANSFQSRKKVDKALSVLERKIAQIQEKISQNEQLCLKLSEEIQNHSGDEALRKARELAELGEKNSVLEEQWFALMADADKLKTQT
ncbi:MAG: ABC-F family ATP-binding cassette domain-containing protein, partial [Bdellovibrionales bacterium]|nr:ABC-F family ATP-binding cassette domain-containing protein [Bdellovibrionales bacterium]